MIIRQVLYPGRFSGSESILYVVVDPGPGEALDADFAAQKVMLREHAGIVFVSRSPSARHSS